MSNLENTEKKISIEEYNEIPVHYCDNCLSLKVMILDEQTDYCDSCGSTNISVTDIESWQEKYNKKYNK